jgi:DNA repair exonuclease SbcCD ATPase subunit
MRITELELVEFGCHKHLTLRPAAGVNGLIGPIGSGKSAVLAR